MTESNHSNPESDAEPRRYPTFYQKKVIWTALTGAGMAVIAWLAVSFVQIVGTVLKFLQPVLVPLAAAGILAYLLEPIIRKVTDRGVPRFRAMLGVFTFFHLLMLFIFISVVGPTVAHISAWAGTQNRETIVSGIEKGLDETLGPLEKFFAAKPAEQPKKEEAAKPPPAANPESNNPNPVVLEAAKDVAAQPQRRWWKEWLSDEKHSSMVTDQIKSLVGTLFTGFLGVFGYLIGFIMVPLYLYYFLKEADSIKKNWSQFIPLRASRFKTELVDVLTEINGYLIAFFRGAMLVSLIDGLLVGLFLILIGLPYATLIGLCVALFGLLPYAGHLICWIAAVVISIAHFGVESHRWAWMPQFWAYPVLVTAIFAVIMKINAMVTAPKIIGDAVGLHPLTVIFSVLFWSLLLGPLLGALLAVPLSAAVKVIFRRYIWLNWKDRPVKPADVPA